MAQIATVVTLLLILVFLFSKLLFLVAIGFVSLRSRAGILLFTFLDLEPFFASN